MRLWHYGFSFSCIQTATSGDTTDRRYCKNFNGFKQFPEEKTAAGCMETNTADVEDRSGIFHRSQWGEADGGMAQWLI